MIRFRATGLLVTLAVAASVFPSIASASLPFWGPIIPDAYNVCAANWGLVIEVINRIIQLGITLALVIVAPLMIALAGFEIILNPTNPNKREQAKGRLFNVIAGIVIALSAWMIVSALMAVLYRPDPNAGFAARWSDIIRANPGTECIKLKASLNQTKYEDLVTGVGGDGAIVVPSDQSSTGFTYDPGITAQIPTQSPALTALLSCIKGRVGVGVGRISSISDSKITSGQYTFAQCAAQRVCSHAASSCHYGGSGICQGSSYAVDFGDEENAAPLTEAAKACGAKVLNEGDHIHVSIGAANRCGCDVNL